MYKGTYVCVGTFDVYNSTYPNDGYIYVYMKGSMNMKLLEYTDHRPNMITPPIQ